MWYWPKVIPVTITPHNSIVANQEILNHSSGIHRVPIRAQKQPHKPSTHPHFCLQSYEWSKSCCGNLGQTFTLLSWLVYLTYPKGPWGAYLDLESPYQSFKTTQYTPNISGFSQAWFWMLRIIYIHWTDLKSYMYPSLQTSLFHQQPETLNDTYGGPGAHNSVQKQHGSFPLTWF